MRWSRDTRSEHPSTVTGEHRLHILAKLFSVLVQPETLLAFGAMVSCCLVGRRPRWARRTLVTTLGLAVLIGWTGPNDRLLASLESAYQPPTGDLSGFAGVIILGGAIIGEDGWSHAQLDVNDAAERLIEPLRLLSRYPTLRMVYSGGDASIFGGGVAEAELARRFFSSVGIAESRARYQSRSRNTFEDARFTCALLARDPEFNGNKPWLLVTSAAHMKRAISVFQAEGCQVTAYPVDFRSHRQARWFRYHWRQGLDAWRVWLREECGALVYAMLGRTTQW